jgi:hypothetical protein
VQIICSWQVHSALSLLHGLLLFSFVFILAGAPIIESTHNELKFTAPLLRRQLPLLVKVAILNLAKLFFNYHGGVVATGFRLRF